MRARVLEQCLIGKAPNQGLCEDGIIFNDNFIGVADGCTDKSGVVYDGMTSGKFAALSLVRAFDEVGAQMTIREGVDLVSARLAQDIARARDDAPDDLPTVSFVVLAIERREIWRVGDCSFALDERMYDGAKLIDSVTGEARAAYLSCTGLGDGDGDGNRFIQSLLNLQYRLLNRDDGSRFSYGAINSRHVPDRFLEVTLAAGTTHAVLHTDGYPTTETTLAGAEAALAARLERDPHMVEIPSAQKGLVAGNGSYDDRAYLRIALDWEA